MPAATDTKLPLDYPDVLGTITGGARLNVDFAQCALAVYPPSTAVGQPFEGLLLLQNIIDKPIQVDVALQLPRKDSSGNRITMITPKDQVQVTLQGGETGLLHIPIVPHLPTQPSQDNILNVQVQVRGPAKGYRLVRHIHGGRAATALNMSPFRLNILREVGFVALSTAPGTLSARFAIIPGAVEKVPAGDIRYEVLWTAKELPSEQMRYTAMAAQAERFAATISRALVMEPLYRVTEQRFAQAGLPLHPGEALYISKTLTYAMEDGLDLEPGFKLTEGRWFHRLVSVVNDQYIIEDPDHLVTFLYTAVLFDAVRLGLHMVEQAAKQNFGDANEHVVYADEVVAALERQTPIDLAHAYLPLVLSGVILNARIKGTKENLWRSLAMEREAWHGRQRLADSSFEVISQMLDGLLYEAELFLTRTRVPRPDGV